MREFFSVCTGKLTIFLPLSKCQQTTLHSQLYSPDKGVNINNKFPRSRNCCLCHPFGGLSASVTALYSEFCKVLFCPQRPPRITKLHVIIFQWIFSHFLSFFDASLPYDPLLHCSIFPLLAVVTRTCHPSFPTTAAFFLPN